MSFDLVQRLKADAERKRKELRELDDSILELEGGVRNLFVPLSKFLAEKSSLDWIVGGQIPEGGFGFLVADPWLGKSTLLSQVALQLAVGRALFGMRVGRRFRVLVLSKEGSRAAFRERVRTAAKKLGIEEKSAEDWMIHTEGPGEFLLGSSRMEAIVRESGADLVILDTLRLFWEGDENKPEQFSSRVTRPIRDLNARYGATFWVVHHHRKAVDETTGEELGWQKGRGTGAMYGDSDFWWRLEKVKGAPDGRRIFCDKNKYGRAFDPIDLVYDGGNAIFRVVEEGA